MDKSIRTQLDACRPGKADMLDAEMDALRTWIELSDDNQRIAETAELFDQAVVDAMSEFPVDVPSGLRQKLNDSLNFANSESDVRNKSVQLAGQLDDDGRLLDREFLQDVFVEETEEDQVAENEKLETAAETAHNPNSRRVMLKTILGLAAAILVLLGIYASGIFRSPDVVVVDHNELAREAGDWQPTMVSGRWDTNLDRVPVALSDRLNVTPRQWKRISTKFDSNGVVVDLVPSDADPAFLYILHADRDYKMQLPNQFDLNQIYPANGCWVGAYQDGDVTYVLVVKGDKDRFRQIVKTMKEIV